MTAVLPRSENPVPPAPRRAEGRPRRNWIVPLLLVLVGIAVLLYPVAATQYNNIKQREFSHQYNQDVEQTDPSALNADLENARAYNATLRGVPILDPWLQQASDTPGTSPYRTYETQLGRFEAMARVRVPTASIDLPVRHGTGDEAIGRGAGHLYGTSLPVGGPGTHAVLTSHTGMADATLFDHLNTVGEGDLMFVDVAGETLAYRVDQIKVVLPDEIGDLTTEAGRDQLTLFTCTPYAVNTHRLLVRGERVPYTPDMAPQPASPLESALRLEAWMWWLVAGAAVGLVLVALIARRERKRAGAREARRA